MISFSARGKKFDIPYKYILENINESVLLRILSLLPENMNEKIDGSIFIDINPVYLNEILQYIYKKSKMIPDLNNDNDIVRRELCYLSVINEYEPEWINHSLKENSQTTNNIQSEQEYKIIIIMTSNGKKIKLCSSSVQLWCESNFKDIICGKNDMHIISKNDDVITVWIDMDYKMCNSIISFLRDGINVHHKFLFMDKHILNNVLHYGICEQQELNTLKNRITRMNELNVPTKKREINIRLDFIHERALCFNEDELSSGVFTERSDDWRYERTQKKIPPLHVIQDPEFLLLKKKIKSGMSEKKEMVHLDYRDYYYETTLTYPATKEEMELIEHYYFRYFIGYIS